MQAVEDFEDALAQRSASHDAVVDDDEVVTVGPQGAVADVVNMGGEVVALAVVGDEGTHLDVFPHHLFRPHLVVKFTEAVGDAVVGHLGGVGDVGEDGALDVSVDGLQDGWSQLLSQSFTLLIDVAVGTPAEVYAFKTAGAQLSGGHNLFQMTFAVATHDEGLARHQLMNIVALEVEGCLQHGALAGYSHNLVVAIVERRTDAPGVAYGKHKTLGFCLHKQPFHLAVEAVSHQLQRDVRVAVDTR